MALFGSSSKATTNNTSTNVANYNTGSAPASNFTVAGGISTGKNSQITIETSDFGAIAEGAGLARLALQTNAGAIDAVRQASDAGLSALRATTDRVIDKTLSIAGQNQVSESAQGQRTLFLLALVAAGAFIAARAFR